MKQYTVIPSFCESVGMGGVTEGRHPGLPLILGHTLVWERAGEPVAGGAHHTAKRLGSGQLRGARSTPRFKTSPRT